MQFSDRLARLRFGSLRQRIAALYAVLFAIVLTVMIMLVSAGIEQFGEHSAQRDLAANARVFDEIIELRARQMRGSADVLAHDFGFREAVATGDGPTISSALRSLGDRTHASSAFVVDLDGSVTSAGGTTTPDGESIWYALDEGRERGMVRMGDGLALAAAAPIEAPDLLGWLVIAQPLDQNEMARLSKLAAVETSATVRDIGNLPQDLALTPVGDIYEENGEARNLYLLNALPSLEDGLSPRLVLRHSLGEALQAYSGLKYTLFAVGFAGLALVIALGGRVAQGVAGPIAKLDSAVRRFGQGETVELPQQTDDEVGRLASSFGSMMEAIEERERKIIHVGLHDGLTNLPNRRLFAEQLSQHLARRSNGERILVAYCDLDDFKVVNDTMGHPAGDTMLRHVAECLRQELQDAVIARLGGDEFAILMIEKNPNVSLFDHARRIKDCFERQIRIEGQLADCSASIGIAIAPSDGEDGVTLLKHADLALYRAKRDGKANFHFFEASLDEQARRRREMELDLRLALKEGQFALHFQPLYSLRKNELTGFEALIRWQHPTKGMISPAEFIPLAEETGLILPIGEWVIREACHAASQWPGNFSVAVNISPKQFSAPGLSSIIMQALTTSGLPPQQLELEITESVFIADVDKVLSVLHGVRDLGVRISLDDFGTGYSSLSYLRQFPFDKVKIDQSFVRDLCQEGKNAHAVIRAITTLAEALGMETLAEGVESPEQRQVLEDEGCGFGQGYLFSRPVPASAMNAIFGQAVFPARQSA
ncbi:EAL domain-containing protein [Erythrobacter litoralis]|uniref:putative bifunctional diguanylate cyclase/phosphodiesterase n=1 Tax=Erythrobacter litoralis TaxID=39960 RepID=UPI0024348475|nr:EAL domain-containing protein [Erythrobacter litoralis]MDG6078057.1 EAL domain-containing protein [Erythrobacter litoralis]